MSVAPPPTQDNRRARKPRPPLTAEKLQDLALHYAGKYATSRAKLTAYLLRKIKERGWGGEAPPDVEALVRRLAELRYVDDAAYAVMKAGGLSRAGYGKRRVAVALRTAGIEEADRTEADDITDAEKWRAAETFARRKRIGPFADEPAPREQREKQLAAFLRAGHGFDMARRWVRAEPGEMPDADDI